MSSLNADALFELLSDNGFAPEYMEDDTEIALCCPLCQDDRERLYISIDQGQWLCFHCSESGGLYELLHNVLDMEGAEALDAKRDLLKEDSADPFDFHSYAPSVQTFTGVGLPEEYTPMGKDSPSVFLKYLAKRGVDLDLAISMNMGYATEGRYAYRIILPVITDGQLYTFVARTVFKRCPQCLFLVPDCICSFTIRKVLTPEGGRPRLTLYNLERVRHGEGPVVLMEGAFDALRLPDSAVALLGSAISPTQVSLLSGLERPVTVCLDGDDAGRNGAIKVADGLTSAMVKVRIAHLPDDMDPGSAPEKILKEALDNATKFVVQ